MPRSMKSASLSQPSKRKRSPLGKRLIAGLQEAVDHARGGLALPSYTMAVPEHVEAAKIRQRLDDRRRRTS